MSLTDCDILVGQILPNWVAAATVPLLSYNAGTVAVIVTVVCINCQMEGKDLSHIY